MTASVTDNLEILLQHYPDLYVEDDRLCGAFKFESFKDAFSFIAAVAYIAEQQNHHPRIENEYNIVKLASTTHDAGHKITNKDIAFYRALYEFHEHDQNQ
jgi:4a-hydroxytetrahydrobiopterin dehydratase